MHAYVVKKPKAGTRAGTRAGTTGKQKDSQKQGVGRPYSGSDPPACRLPVSGSRLTICLNSSNAAQSLN